MHLKNAFGRLSRAIAPLAVVPFAVFAVSTTAAAQNLNGSVQPASVGYSSSLVDPETLPNAPSAGGLLSRREPRALPAADREPRPFHSLAVGLIFGTGGLGVELATPITTKWNLRGSASLFRYRSSFVVDTIPIDGTIHLSNYNVSADFFPRARSFHISPGVTVYDNTRYNATIFVPGNQVVVFNDQNYTSDPNDPIRGTALVHFGRAFAPRLTVGYGNVIRHRTAGLTFPVEVGFEVIHRPYAIFNLTGSSCDNQGDCSPIQDDPQTQQNILEQQNEINEDIRPLRLFPILSFGVSYKFGH